MNNKSTLTIVGVSPRNGYYEKQSNITFALQTIIAEQGWVCVMVPDVPDIYNYLAFGYDAAHAKENALSIGNQFRLNLREICLRSGYSYADSGHAAAQVRVIDWQKEVENTALFQKKRSEIQKCYEADSEFRDDARHATILVLEGRASRNGRVKAHIAKVGIDAAADHAVNYILSEIALLLAAPQLFGTAHIDYVYHREWPIYKKLLAGHYACGRPENIGFRIVSAEASIPH